MKIWNEFLSTLEKEMGKETIEKWLRPLKVVKFDACNIYLDASDAFQIVWFDEHMKELFATRFLSSNGSPIKLHFSLNGAPHRVKRKKLPTPEVKEHFTADHIASHATLESFIPGENSQLTHDILSEVSSAKPIAYNPIFIYGPKGCGKTHLLMAIANLMKQEGKSVYYVRCETFTEHVIRAFRTSSLQEFRLAYRDLDCLIIDDIQLLRRKTTTQEELFHTFNRLHTQGIQILLAANLPPHQLEGIEERLKSRFEWGITLPLGSPNLEIRKKILEERAKALSIPLTEILTAFLLETFESAYSLVRALEALALRLHQSKQTITIQLINHLLKDLIDEEGAEKLTPERIVSEIGKHFRIQSVEILGRSQSKTHTLPRKIAMYLCRKELQMPYLKIGDFFSRDHSTVMSSVKLIEKGLKNKDPSIMSALLSVKKKA